MGDYITAPAFLASALVNGDCSSIETYSDKRTLASVRRALRRDGLQVVDLCRDADGNPDEPRFTWQFRLYGGRHQGGEVVNYAVRPA